ncbi:MAG TPA: DUF302 domain-containing protein [Planctomycetota bacterium]|nr:DUF302 domain-containing protein [Planctomycetota bacterium]
MNATTTDPIRYIVASTRSVEQAQAALEAAIQARRFSVLHTYDLKRTLHEKGFELPAEVRVLELCNASQADKVLKTEIGLNMALPCRISIWQQGGRTMIGMLRPKALLKMLSDAPALRAVAEEVERNMVEMVDAAG